MQRGRCARAEPGYPDGMARVPVRWLLLALALALAGAAAYVVADGVVEALSLGLIGLATVVAVSAVFYAVGMSEDRERARDDQRR